jgi:hypothetical protein
MDVGLRHCLPKLWMFRFSTVARDSLDRGRRHYPHFRLLRKACWPDKRKPPNARHFRIDLKNASWATPNKLPRLGTLAPESADSSQRSLIVTNGNLGIALTIILVVRGDRSPRNGRTYRSSLPDRAHRNARREVCATRGGWLPVAAKHKGRPMGATLPIAGSTGIHAEREDGYRAHSPPLQAHTLGRRTSSSLKTQQQFARYSVSRKRFKRHF